MLRMLNNQLNIIPEPATSGVDGQPNLLNTGLERLAGRRVVFSNDFSRDPIALQPLGVGQKFAGIIREFSPHPRERLVASVDSSCALIGETEEGAIYAGRVATVIASRGRTQSFRRLGPVVFYVNPSSISSIAPGLSRRGQDLVLSEKSIAERFIRIYLERSAQLYLAMNVTDSIIVVDGSLRTSVLELKTNSLSALQLEAERNSSQLVGICKSSGVRTISAAASYLQTLEKSSVYLDISHSVRGIISGIGNNKVTVARFSPASQVFRVDFSSSNAEHEEQIFADLRHNDLFFRGYPETLRLAHHLSVFDSAIVSSVRSYLSKQYGLIHVPTDDLRATILGKLV